MAFLAIIAIPLSFSIATGTAPAFIAVPAVTLRSGRSREVRWPTYGLAVFFILCFAYLSGG